MSRLDLCDVCGCDCTGKQAYNVLFLKWGTDSGPTVCTNCWDFIKSVVKMATHKYKIPTP